MASQRWFTGLCGLLLCGFAVGAGAQAGSQPLGEAFGQARAAELGIPAQLSPWVPWVLYGQGSAVCPNSGSGAVCVWPAELALDLKADGGRFALRLFAERDAFVGLPGTGARWPLDVLLDGRPAVVLSNGAAPRVYVRPGQHRITGHFTWGAIPESIATPRTTGRVVLRVDGKSVVAPRREDDGRLWLRAGQNVIGEAEQLELEVSRRVEDGVPLRITTRVSLAVGGKAREVVLATTGVPGSWPIDIKSTLPAQLESDGTLRLQLAAGQHLVEITALAPVSKTELKMPAVLAPWPEQETWVWAPDSELRQVELSGAAHIDPARTNLAADWQGLSTYVLGAEGQLALETRRRGEAHPAPNRVHIEREMWLDADGSAFTVRDRLAGKMFSGWRLNLLRGELGRFAVGGADQLITLSPQEAGESLRGVELRAGEIEGVAEWRLPRSGAAMAAVAWSESAESLSVDLHLPPGYLLLDATGPDRVRNSLFSRWDLWSFFFVLLVALATAKLCGKGWGGLALLALGLSYHEPGAPGVVFLGLLSAVALSRLALSGAAGKAARGLLFGSLAVLLVIVVPFFVDQVRLALYPHLQARLSSPDDALFEDQQEAEVEVDDDVMTKQGEAVPASAPPRKSMVGASYGSGRAMAKLRRSPKGEYSIKGIPLGSAVQTGPGLPTWSHGSYQLSWSGPVQREQELSMWLVPPVATRGLALLRILLLAGLVFALLRHSGLGGRGADFSAAKSVTGKAATAALAFLLCLIAPQPQAQAQTDHPSAAVMSRADVTSTTLHEALRKRLLAPPACSPNCLSVTQLVVQVKGGRLTTQAEVHAGAIGVYRAPGPLAAWVPDRVHVDGEQALASARLEGGFLYIRLSPGRHRVDLSGPLVGSDTLNLQLGTMPQRVRVRADGWQVDGLRGDGDAGESIQLTRKLESPRPGEAVAELSPWFEVNRRMFFGPRFEVSTVVHRSSDLKSAVLLRYPLLAGESVTDRSVEVVDGFAVLRMAPGQSLLAFESRLAIKGNGKEKAVTQLTLQAPGEKTRQGRPWSESWSVQCATFYACEAKGLTPVAQAEAGQTVSRYRPYPGERLQLTVTRLAGARGASSTVDRVTMEVKPGEQLSQASLTLQVRSSVGATSHVELPGGATLGEVTVDGQARTARQVQDAVELALDPGLHRVRIEWRQAGGLGTHFKVPQVSVKGSMVNTTVRIEVPGNRWLLWAYGPAWGPAILFWGYLLVAVLLGVAIARVPNTPLRTHQWVLLALGLTQVDVIAALCVVGWFFAMVARAKWSPAGRWRFNGIQFVLTMLTLVAAGVLAEAVREGLVVQPDMQVVGAGSYQGQLSWYVDRLDTNLPTPGIVSLPLWVYKGLMLAWALWLAASALSWLRWGWQAFSSGGRWRRSEKKRKLPQVDKPVISGQTLPPKPPSSFEPDDGLQG